MNKIIPLLVCLCLAHTHCMAQETKPTAKTTKGDPVKAILLRDDQQISGEDYSLPWQPTMMKDVESRVRVWRDLDLAEPKNAAFRGDETANGRGGLLHTILAGALSERYKLYAAADDRFTRALTRAEMAALLAPVATGGKGITPENVTGFRIKEDRLYLNDGRMVIRIVGIAPLMSVSNNDGGSETVPAFWVFYPDAREYFGDQKLIGDPATDIDRAFASRSFVSSVIKSDNMLPVLTK